MTMENGYQNLKLAELKKIAESRNIICKETRDSLIESLVLFDKGKYVYPTTNEKTKDGYIVGISLNNGSDLIQIGRLIEKGEAKSLNNYCNNRVHYISNIKFAS